MNDTEHEFTPGEIALDKFLTAMEAIMSKVLTPLLGPAPTNLDDPMTA